jgi:hypothetical protein
MTDEFDDDLDPLSIGGNRRSAAMVGCSTVHRLPELVSAAYELAPAPVRSRFIEYLLDPVGPLALLAIANGAFGHLLYRLRRDAVPISLDDVARITSSHVLELARYLEQSSPEVLLRIGSLIGDRPIELVTIGGSALLIGLMDWMRRQTD